MKIGWSSVIRYSERMEHCNADFKLSMQGLIFSQLILRMVFLFVSLEDLLIKIHCLCVYYFVYLLKYLFDSEA